MQHIAYDQVVTPALSEGAIINDEFPGFREDYLALHCLMRRAMPARIMEIGTYLGKGTRIICNAVPTALVMSLDLHPLQADRSTQHIAHQGPHRQIGMYCDRRYTQFYGDSLEFDFGQAWPIQAWFIDGEHDMRHAYSDARQAIHSGARLIVFHDADIEGVAAGIEAAFEAVPKYQLFRVTGTRIAYATR